ncbi:hypothetical protein HHI36_015220 [Cryptolaemus montrouzieri]|uniref:Uncharacterized protein n=1 Tax=Cryptolaemus montrouzieri TaxID=559131 RepID=A0ABD2N5S3_9CUCU
MNVNTRNVMEMQRKLKSEITMNEARPRKLNETMANNFREFNANRAAQAVEEVFSREVAISRSLTKATKPQTLTIKAKNGETLTSKPDVIERWKTYCQELMAYDNADSHSHNIEATEELEPPILEQKVENDVQRLSEQKAAANDGIETEILKATEDIGKNITPHLHKNLGNGDLAN